MKKQNKKNDSFWKTVSNDYDIVQGWPKWKQRITISTSTAMSGKFTESKKK